MDVIHAAAAGMHAPPGDALDDVLVGHRDLEHVVDRDVRVLHRVGLRHGAREAVEQVALRAVGLRQPVLDEADDDVVGNQCAGVHDLLRGEAERRAGP